jgi:hypothetical protein
MIIETPVNSLGTKTLPQVKPYFDRNIFNMGLENYGIALYDNVTHYEQLACLEINGLKRYVTGLNEFAPEVKNLQGDQRTAKIKEIRRVVAQLEKELASNIIDEDDAEFWNKVKLLRPDNDTFWKGIHMKCGNQPVFLDPKQPHDLIKIYAIEAGGFDMIAPSYEAARSRDKAPKFYLDKQVETISTKTEIKKLRNKALAELQKLYDKNINKLFYIMKVLDLNSVQYKKSTPNDILYDNADSYINGEGTESNHRRAIQSFLDATRLDIDTLKIRAVIKDGTYLRVLTVKSDGFVYHTKTNSLMGRNTAEVTEYLKNPLNEQILSDIIDNVEKQWNN